MIIADTGFWLAVANRRDRHHARAIAVLGEIDEPLICTWPVLTETCHLMLTRLGVNAQTRFLQGMENGLAQLYQLEPDHLARLQALMEKYADLPMDLADASLVVLAEDQNDGRILSTDQRDFQAYRWKSQQPFQNMLLDDAL